MGLPVNSFSPQALGQNAIGATQTGSWLNTAGTGISSISNAIAGAYQSRVALNNAALATQDAGNAIDAGNFAASKSLLATGQQIGREKAGQAANNLDVNTGSPVDVRSSTQSIGDLDAALIHYNAARQAYGYGIQASNEKSNATLGALATGFGIAKGAGATYASYISGSNALASQRLTFGATGVPNG